MAQSTKTPQEFIQTSFSPLVAVLRSPQVDQIVGRNNLTFVELLQPFCHLSSEGQIRDPSGTQCSVKNWRLVIRDVHWKPPPPTDARKLLNHAVSSNNCEQTISLDIGNYKVDIPSATPWLDSWREKYVEVQFASEHEFTKHFVSCMLVGSTLDGDVSDTFKNLVQIMAQLQTVAPPKLPRWFNSNVLRTYVLLHDLSTPNKDKAERAFESLKQTYGAGNCFFVCINSRTASDPDGEHLLSDPWSQYISRRSETNNDLNSNANSLPRTPVDARAMSSMPVNVVSGVSEEQENFAAPPQTEALHPLSPAEEPETVFDSANTLQNDTLSGSTESVSSYLNAAWESTSTSTGTNAAAVHGAALSSQDMDALRQFVNDFAFKALLPYFERQISGLHEAVANRKGVSRSLLSATKRWFGTNKPGTNTTVNTVIYTPECPELQLRRLGDLWFMCGQWSRAFDSYHTAKREFNADSAWLCYAGALEMAALSAFMADEPTRKTYMYMEESIVTYLNTCRMVPYAVRATILSVQCLSSRGLYGEAAKQLIRMTSEDSDLRSAVLLEQAALCFVAGPSRRAMPRKYAFHMVLAGNRYSKAGQKKHAYRCYKQAFQVYEKSGWRLAVDHVQFALGRLATGLKLAEEAASWLAAPLAPGSAQPPPQQLALLREYTLAHQQWMEKCEERRRVLPVLPLPLLNSQATCVVCGGVAPLSAPGRVPASATSLADAAEADGQRYWSKMEEMLLQEVQGGVPLVFKPTLTLYTDSTDNAAQPTVPQGEPVHVSVQFENPLAVALTLSEVELLWQFEWEGGGGAAVSNEGAVAAAGEGEGGAALAQLVSGRGVSALTLPPHSSHTFPLSLTPLTAGQLRVLGVAYKLVNSIEGSDDSGSGTVISGKQLFQMRGPRLKKSKDTARPEYAADKRLEITVTPSAPCLQMTFSEMSERVVCGELVSVDVELRNVGPVELRNLHVAVSHPDCMRLVPSHPTPSDHTPFAQHYAHKYQDTPHHLEERVLRAMRWRACCKRHVSRVGSTARATLHIRPRVDSPTLRLLAYYEGPALTSPAPVPQPYRLLRHTFHLQVLDSVKIVAIPRRNIRLKGEECVGSETLNLAVEVKNISKSREEETVQIEVLEASLLSRQWRLTEMVAPETARQVLSSHERVHLVLRGCRSISDLDGAHVIHSGIKVNSEHPETSPSIDERPYSEFVTDFPSPWDEDFDAKGQGKNKKRGALIDSTLVVRWKAHVKEKAGRSVVGQHYLWLDCFTDKVSSRDREEPQCGAEAAALRLFGRDETPAIANGADPALRHSLIYRLEHSGAVNHNFRTRKICLVPVKLHIVNCCNAPVMAFVDWTSTSEKVCGVGWTGAVSGAGGGLAVALGAFQARSVWVCAAVTAPGTYQLGDSLRVTCSAGAAAATPVHHSNTNSLVVIEQSS